MPYTVAKRPSYPSSPYQWAIVRPDNTVADWKRTKRAATDALPDAERRDTEAAARAQEQVRVAAVEAERAARARAVQRLPELRAALVALDRIEAVLDDCSPLDDAVARRLVERARADVTRQLAEAECLLRRA